MSQISIADLKKAGIRSENDLKKLGISENEIGNLKSEYAFNQNQKSKKENLTEHNKDSVFSPKNETPVILESRKSNLDDEIVYGQSIFGSGAVKIQKNSDRIKATGNYIIGSGDRISISIWGYSEYSEDFTVDDLGNITPKLVGKINLKGRSFEDAKSILKSKFSRVYDLRNSKIGIELSYSKIISINIMGEVISPGTYSIPGINTAFNILSLAKGPSKSGSVRSIAIVRNGQKINTLDVYEFMNTPTKASIHLNDGDFIIVPPLGNTVSINGEITREGDFEIKENETLSDILRFAGNLTADANSNNITILRKTLNGSVVYSYKLEDAKSTKLINGDKIIIPKISQITSNKITLKGEINGPGIFEFKEGESVGNLFVRAGGLTTEADLSRAHIYRLNKDLSREIIELNLNDQKSLAKIVLKDLDEITIFSKKMFHDQNFVSVNGMVRNPGKVKFMEKMTLNNLLTIVGGYLAEADLTRIEIERIDFSSKGIDSSSYVKFSTHNLEHNGDFELKPFDIVNVRGLPGFKFHQTVSIEGEIKYPGNYSLLGDQVKISDVIERAGGLTNFSFGEKAYIERSEDSLGVILLNLKTVLKNKNSPYNYCLRPKDKIVIPHLNNIVSISGAIIAKTVKNSDVVNTAFLKGKRASFYIKKYAGGYDFRANRRKVLAITLNGQVKRSKLFGFLKPKVEPGDKISVPYKKQKEKRTKENKINWNDQIENVSIKLTGLATLWLLISQISRL